MTDLRITHVSSEIIREGDPDLRITHASVEILRGAGFADLRITHAVVEVIRENVLGGSTNFFLMF